MGQATFVTQVACDVPAVRLSSRFREVYRREGEVWRWLILFLQARRVHPATQQTKALAGPIAPSHRKWSGTFQAVLYLTPFVFSPCGDCSMGTHKVLKEGGEMGAMITRDGITRVCLKQRRIPGLPRGL